MEENCANILAFAFIFPDTKIQALTDLALIRVPSHDKVVGSDSPTSVQMKHLHRAPIKRTLRGVKLTYLTVILFTLYVYSKNFKSR